MSDTIIKLENISKQYRLGQVGTQTMRGDFQRWWHRMRGKEDPTLKIGSSNQLDTIDGEYVWALKDINLEVKQGEVLGIIGKNGAGKSTLLKLLSRVTAPTTGKIKVKGRIASLLEVGTGFHPDLTGRENIFLNGAIMGMTKTEIKSKFDEIVDFAGVAKYVDTPVKRYSSGMYVRLAFAVAAHLEPDILVVDEVLAVGDAEFQKKAIGKMQDISISGGRTVLFVSHNMAAVNDLCNNAILLTNGTISSFGIVKDIIDQYLVEDVEIELFKEWSNIDEAPGDKNIKIKKIYSVNEKQEIIQYSLITETIGIYIEYQVLVEIDFFALGINVYTANGVHLLSSHDTNKYIDSKLIAEGKYYTIIWIPGNLLQNGDYFVTVAFMRYNPFTVIFHSGNLLRINIIDTKNESARPEDCNEYIPGIIRPKLIWNERKVI